jgi:hypothetical protein
MSKSKSKDVNYAFKAFLRKSVILQHRYYNGCAVLSGVVQTRYSLLKGHFTVYPQASQYGNSDTCCKAAAHVQY